MNDFPKVFRVRQSFDGPRIEDIESEVQTQLDKLNLQEKIRPGQTVAITAGSRGIANIALIIKSAVEHLKKTGAVPFIVPAMGSHGGATPEGQRELIESFGINEDYCGCPIRADMSTVVVGRAPQEFDVHIDKFAYEADHVLVCGRVKPHTGFSGEVQSGLLKMMLIGLGKCNGAGVYHRAAADFGFDQIAYSIADMIISKAKVVAGLGIVENAYDETAVIEAVAPQQLIERDKALLKMATKWMPKLPFDRADVLLVDEIGKNISGTGMDTNLTGRKHNDHAAVQDEFPKVKRIVVRALTPESHGNAVGIGLCEFCLQRVIDDMDMQKTALNGITSLHVSGAMIPLAYPDDKAALSVALDTIGMTPRDKAKLIWIRNTLKVAEVECSEAYLQEARQRDDLTILSAPRPMPMRSDGFLPDSMAVAF